MHISLVCIYISDLSSPRESLSSENIEGRAENGYGHAKVRLGLLKGSHSWVTHQLSLIQVQFLPQFLQFS